MTYPTLHIVVVNWNTGNALSECLRSIATAVRDTFALIGVCVVDNASTDNSLDGVPDMDPRCVLQRNPVNLGFAAACNQGARDCKADYLLFLNPDTRLTASSLAAPIAFMEQPENRDVGICGISLLDDRGEPATCWAKFPTAALICAEAIGLHRLLSRRFNLCRRRAAGSEAHARVDQVIGAFFLVRNSVFKLLGGFDARFFMYYEEVDFSFRARSIGHQSAILFSAFAYHTGCVSSGRAKGVRLFYSLRSRLKYAQKHFSAGGLICVALLTFTVEPVFRGLRAIFSGSRDELRLLVDNYQRLAAESASAACRRALTQMTRRWASSAASGGT